MKGMFSMDNPVIQMLARVGDLIIVNLLFLICSLPIVTLGASLTAMHKVTQDIVSGEESGTFKTFFRAFRDNFKQATAAWLLMLLFFVGMGCNYLLVLTYCTGNVALVLKCLVAFLVILVLAVTAYLFPLIVRYENNLREHFINATILAVVKLPRTVAIVGRNLLPAPIVYASTAASLNSLERRLILGFSFISYITSCLLVPVFQQLEDGSGRNMKVD